MTVFTVNAFDNCYFKDGKPADPLLKACFESWLDNGVDIKVFDYNSLEVIEAKEIFKDYIKLCEGKKNYAADVIRLYILSLYPNMLYIDTDVCLIDKSILDDISKIDDLTFYGHFYFIWNGSRTDKVKTLLEWYKTLKEPIADKFAFIENSNRLKCGVRFTNTKTIRKKIYHTSFFVNNQKIKKIFTNDINEILKIAKHGKNISIASTKYSIRLEQLIVRYIPSNLPKTVEKLCLEKIENPEAYYDSIHS